MSMMEPSKKPLNVLIKQLHGNIEVVLKNGYEYRGKMIKVDGHMNILLEGATEYKEEQLMTNYGNVLLRGNNVLYIVLNTTLH
jgi:small nuclear ribonucleoprotein